MEPAREPADFADGHPVVELGPLGHIPDHVAQRNGCGPAILAEDRRLAGVRLQDTGEHADGGRFPGPIVTEEGKDGAARYAQVQPPYRRFTAKTLGQAVDFDDRVHQRFSRVRR